MVKRQIIPWFWFNRFTLSFMIRMIQSTQAAHAKSYFSEALAKADYYISDQELQGYMQGKLAERLGITGPATREIFHALCDNIDPKTGKPLTPRTKEERTVGYDINFHCPKSVSILHALSTDDHLLRAFEESVRATMRDIEADAKTRVRKEGQYDDRATSELVWAEFVHQTARPVDGCVPDPHLHIHAYVFNCTWDENEKSVKATQFRDIKRDMPYYQARFHKRLSDKLIDLGYGIRRTDASFEIEHVPQPVIDLFSKRTDEIGRVAKEQGITDARELDALGARTRAKKQKGLPMDALKADWRRQIHALGTKDEGQGERIIRHAPERVRELVTAKDCVDQAVLHSFERASVMRDRRLLASAYRQGIGERSITLEAMTEAMQQDQRLIQVTDQGQTHITTKEVLAEEQKMVSLARSGQGQLRPLYAKAPESQLDGQQRAAVDHILTTTNRVSIIRGAAGSGKTTLMQEAVRQIEAAGKNVTVVAPTSQASRGVLKDEGFKHADTVANLLINPKMQNALAGQVLWVDEAGLLGTRDMTALLELTQKQNARLILGGDTRQHASVIRGDALRILNTVGQIRTAEVSKIYRQRSVEYRRAVEDLAQGRVEPALRKLDQMQWIKEMDPLKPHEQLVMDFTATIKAGKTALVVSPTHKQSEEVTNIIREKLRKDGLLGKREIIARRLVNLNLTEAEKADWRNLEPGHLIQFNQNMEGIQRGSRWKVQESSDHHVTIQAGDGETVMLPTERSAQYDVYREKDLALSKGDLVRVTRNGFDRQDQRLNNGQLLQVAAVRKNGAVELFNPTSKKRYSLDKEFGHLAHAYCLTSHASQGKTVDEVFISQPASTFPATDAKQLYVSVSRGRDRVHVYTDDKKELLSYASRIGDRQSALELMRRRRALEKTVDQHTREQMHKSAPERTRPPVDLHKPITLTRDRDYEPGF